VSTRGPSSKAPRRNDGDTENYEVHRRLRALRTGTRKSVTPSNRPPTLAWLPPCLTVYPEITEALTDQHISPHRPRLPMNATRFSLRRPHRNC